MAKASKHEVLKRVEQIMLIMLDGGEFHDIKEFADSEDKDSGKAPWNVTTRQLRRYQDQAWKWIEKRTEKNRGRLLARHIMTRRRLQAKALEQGDIKTALSVAKDLAELEGMYPAKKLVEKPKTDLKGRVEELMEQKEMRQVLQDAQQWVPPTLAIAAPEPEAKEA